MFKNNLFFLHNRHNNIKYKQKGILTKTKSYLNHCGIVSLKKVSTISGYQLVLGVFHILHYNITLATTRKHSTPQKFTIFEQTNNSTQGGETIKQYIMLRTQIKNTNKLVLKNGKLLRKKYVFYSISRKLTVKNSFTPKLIQCCNLCKQNISGELIPPDQRNTFHTYLTTDKILLRNSGEL